MSHNKTYAYTYSRSLDNKASKHKFTDLPTIDISYPNKSKQRHPNLVKLEKLLKSNQDDKNPTFRLGNIQWNRSTSSKSRTNHEFFNEIVPKLVFADDYIVNIPIQTEGKTVKYIELSTNKLNIIDALMHSGTQKKYVSDKICRESTKEKCSRYVYSEHAGVLSVRDNEIQEIIVDANTNRYSSMDRDINLPGSLSHLYDYPYLFHTHPVMSTLLSRISLGVMYEFPSASDLSHFANAFTQGLQQHIRASLIAAPEGLYIIRPIKYYEGITLSIPKNMRIYFDDFIHKLNLTAITDFSAQYDLASLAHPDNFYTIVAPNYKYIQTYNSVIRPMNLFVEYYPRININGIWVLPTVYLPYY